MEINALIPQYMHIQGTWGGYQYFWTPDFYIEQIIAIHNIVSQILTLKQSLLSTHFIKRSHIILVTRLAFDGMRETSKNCMFDLPLF